MDPCPLVSREEFQGARQAPVLPPHAAEKIVGLLAGKACFTARPPAQHPPGGHRPALGDAAPGRGHDPRIRHRRVTTGSRFARWGADGPPDLDAGPQGHHGRGPNGGRNTRRRPTGASADNWADHPGRPSEPRRPSPLPEKDAVVGNLNKLARANYPVILGKMRALLCDDNLRTAIARILVKAYREPDSTILCVNMLQDICGGLSDSVKSAALKVVASDVDDTVNALRDSVLLPRVDPARDYGQFCDVNALKRVAVGRSRTLYPVLKGGLLPGLCSDNGPDTFFTRHVELLGTLVSEAAPEAPREANAAPEAPREANAAPEAPREANAAPEEILARPPDPAPGPLSTLDVLAAVEVLLECCEVMVGDDLDKRTELRAMVDAVGGPEAFPSTRSRFKVIDLVADKQRRANNRTRSTPAEAGGWVTKARR